MHAPNETKKRIRQTGHKNEGSSRQTDTRVHLQRLVRVPIVGRARQRRTVQIGLVVLGLGLFSCLLGRGRRGEGRGGGRCGRADGRRGRRKDGADRGLMRRRVLGVGKRLKAAEADVRAVDLLHGRVASDAVSKCIRDAMQKKWVKSRKQLASSQGIQIDMAVFTSNIFRAPHFNSHQLRNYSFIHSHTD
jgi:hypothetical protein